MSLELFGYKNLQEKIKQEKDWVKNNFTNCPYIYDPEAPWLDNAIICRLSVLTPYCDWFGLDQLLSREFNDSLAREIQKLGLAPILEVNAGCGDLAMALSRRGIELTAVDSGQRPRRRGKAIPDSVPQKMNHREAIEKYRPELVICSWMPKDEDWTRDFRDYDFIQAYLLIGVEDEKIWVEHPGWQSRVLKEPNKWSLCRLDQGVDFERPDLWWRHAKVVLFERLPK